MCLLRAMFPHEVSTPSEESDVDVSETDCPDQWLNAGIFLPREELLWTTTVYLCGVARFARDMLAYGAECAGEMTEAGPLEPRPALELLEAVRGGSHEVALVMIEEIEEMELDLTVEDVVNRPVPAPHTLQTATGKAAVSAPLQWIHPTMTGASLGNALLALTCPDMRMPNGSFAAAPFSPMEDLSPACAQAWGRPPLGSDLLLQAGEMAPAFGQHSPWSEIVAAESSFVTLRAPLQRLQSEAAHRDVLPAGFCRVTPKEAARQLMAVPLLSSHFQGLHEGGRACDSYPFHIGGRNDASGVEGACGRLRRVAWVGLTDHFNASICLLHAMFPFEPHPAELGKMHSTNSTHKADTDCPDQWLAASAFLPSEELLWTTTVYLCGVARFARDMLAYGAECAGEMTEAGPLEPQSAAQLINAVREARKTQAWEILTKLENGGGWLHEERN